MNNLIRTVSGIGVLLVIAYGLSQSYVLPKSQYECTKPGDVCLQYTFKVAK